MFPDYPDDNGSGIPDAFENRLPISEILNLEATIPESATPQEPAAPKASAGFLHRLIGNNTFKGSADYGTYRLHIPTEGNAVMLEIKNGISFVACVFRSDEEIRVFISELQRMRTAVFGKTPSV